MRISTLTIFDQSVSSLHRQQNKFIEVGQQIASGRRVVRPSDDPQAASQAVGVSQAMAATEQFADARISARNALSQEGSILGSLVDAITRAKTLLIQGASDSLSDVDRTSIASELRGVRETVLGQANATDGNGRFLFGGYRNSSPPFIKDIDGTVTYAGDLHIREERIDASRLMPVGDNGATIFLSAHSGAGYVAHADAGNQGNMTFSGPRVTDADDPDYGATFSVVFTEDAGAVTYSINGGPEQTYEAGAAIDMGGLSITLDGQPADGDSLTVAPADTAPDLFATLQKAIMVLENPAATETEEAALRNTLNTAMRELDNSMDNILTVRASVGARLNELDTVDTVANMRTLNYEQTLSDLVDLDYVTAISDYSQRQIGLQAAQRTFIDLSGLSLFNQR